MLANGCRSPKYLLLRKPNIWPRKHSSCCFSVSSCSLSIDVDNIIVSSQFLLEVIFSPSSSILKWCSMNADSSSRLLFFFCRRAAGQPSFSFRLAPPGANQFLQAAGRPSISFSLALPGANQFRRAAGRPSWLGNPAEFRRNSAEFRIPVPFFSGITRFGFRFRSESWFPPFF